MPICKCENCPRCEMYGARCNKPADGSVMMPLVWKMPLRLEPKFACKACWDCFCKAWETPIKGLDRPDNAPDDWRSSLFDMMRHAEIALAYERRNDDRPTIQPLSRSGDDRYATEQLKQILFLRKWHRTNHQAPH